MKREYKLIVPEIITREQGAEHLLGALGKPIIKPDGNWTEFLPAGEQQNKGLFEPSCCASEATNHAVATQTKQKPNFSERALAIASNTDPASGADPHVVAETARKVLGFVPEAVLPYDDTITTLEKFYSPKPLPDSIIKEGNKFGFDFSHEWVWNGDNTPIAKRAKLKEALTRGTCAVSVYAWVETDGQYIKPIGVTDNHFVQLVRYDGDNPVIFDSYGDNDTDPFLKTLDPLFDFSIAKVYYLSPKVITPQQKNIFLEILKRIAEALGLISKEIPLVIPPLPKEEKPVFVPFNNIIDEPKPLQRFDWTTKETARHAVRVIADEEGLTVSLKNRLCDTIECESNFDPKVISKPNHNSTRDWGICQYNDGKNTEGQWYWIGNGAKFPSTDYVLAHPEECVREMCHQFRIGQAKLWSCYRKIFGDE